MKIRRTKEEWQQLIEEWKQSGSTQGEFCKERIIPLATFRCKLHQQKQENQETTFEEIKAIPIFQENIIVKFPQGIQLYFKSNCNFHTIQSMLKACYEVLCCASTGKL
jgi:hypothetical protein